MKTKSKVLSFSQLKFVFLFLLITILVGVQNLFLAKWDVTILKDSNFWSGTINTTTAYYLTIILVVLWVAERFVKLDADHKRKDDTLKEFVISPDFNSKFYTYTDDVNLREKIKAFKADIIDKLHKLDSTATLLDRRALKDNDDTNEYVFKRKTLLDQLETSYIEENIMYLKVEYEHIDVNTITNGYTPSKNRRFKKQNSIWKITKDTAPKFTLSTVYTLFFKTFIPDYRGATPEYWYQLVVQLIGLLLSAIWAVNYAPQYIDEQIMTPLNNRFAHVKNFINEVGETDGIHSDTN